MILQRCYGRMRALIEHVIHDKAGLAEMSCLEPVCNRRFMSRTLEEYFARVISQDVFPYGYGAIGDFTIMRMEVHSVDWVITNSSFRLAEDFINRGLDVARHGMAMLTRTKFIESVGRYERLFSVNPPTKIVQFVERVPMVKGRIDRKASTATGYCWLVWEKNLRMKSQLVWIPPCRKALERDDDYQLPKAVA